MQHGGTRQWLQIAVGLPISPGGACCANQQSMITAALLVPRQWQGSNDLQHWLDLRRHCNDATIRLPGQYGSWPITGPAASMPFRAFRLLLLGPTQSSSNPWAFCLSYWELYGYFYKLGVHKGAHVAAAEGAA